MQLNECSAWIIAATVSLLARPVYADPLNQPVLIVQAIEGQKMPVTEIEIRGVSGNLNLVNAVFRRRINSQNEIVRLRYSAGERYSYNIVLPSTYQFADETEVYGKGEASLVFLTVSSIHEKIIADCPTESRDALQLFLTSSGLESATIVRLAGCRNGNDIPMKISRSGKRFRVTAP